MDYNNNNPKTWTLAQRARKVSKGQAKIFLTRSAGDEQRLAKLTQHLDKEKSAKYSELNFAQKLLVKRYGAGKNELENAVEQRRPSRDRSVTWDSTFVTKPDVIDGRSRAVSFERKPSIAQSLATGEVPRFGTTGKEARVNRFSQVSDFQTRKRSQTLDSLDGETNKGETQETRPRASSLIQSPLVLPPIYKTDEHRSLPTMGGLKSRFPTSSIRSTAVPETSQTRKTSITTYFPQGSMTMDEKVSVQFDNSLSSCRYLRRNDDEDKSG